MKDPYEVLGVSRNASDEEIKTAYRALVKKYHPDNYGEDNPLSDLAKEKMQEVNSAYDEIQMERSRRGDRAYTGSGTYYKDYAGNGSESTGIYADIRRALNSKRFGEAEKLLNSISDFDRTAEWHYLYSLVLVRRGRVNDAMRELEIACNLEPDNMEFQKAKEMFNTRAKGYGSTYYGDGTSTRANQTAEDVCDICIKIKMLDCLCECLGGDLIRCI